MIWAPASKGVVGRRRRTLGKIVLAESPVEVSDEAALPILLQVRQWISAYFSDFSLFLDILGKNKRT